MSSFRQLMMRSKGGGTKTLNVEVFGSPTISEDFVVSNFSVNNYVQFDGGRISNAEYYVKFKTPSSSPSVKGEIFNSEHWLDLSFNLNKCIETYNWQTNQPVNLSSPLAYSTIYYVKVVCNGSTRTFYLSTDGITYTQMQSYSDSAAYSDISQNYPFRFGLHGSLNQYAFAGSIYFEDCYIKSNGVIVWQGVI